MAWLVQKTIFEASKYAFTALNAILIFGRIEWYLTTRLFLGVSHLVNDCIMDLTLVLYEYIMLFWWTVLCVHDVTTISKMAVESVMF